MDATSIVVVCLTVFVVSVTALMGNSSMIFVLLWWWFLWRLGPAVPLFGSLGLDFSTEYAIGPCLVWFVVN